MRIFSPILFLIAIRVFSQDPDLTNKIFSYEDSTKVLVQNSRRLIVESIKNGDYIEADRIKDYAENNVDHAQYALFTIAEDFLISYHTNDFSRILITLQNWDSLKGAPYNTYIPENDKLYENLLKQSLKDSVRIFNSISDVVAS